MVFTVRCILGCFLVLLSITIIHPASISLRSTITPIETNNSSNATQNNTIDQHVEVTANIDLETKTEITTQIATIQGRGTVKYTTLPTVEENKIKKDVVDIVELITSENKVKGSEKEIAISTTLPTVEENKIKEDEFKKEEIEKNGANKIRTENGRALEFDISKYTSPEFQSKNNVYSLPTSPENEKYVNPDFIPKPTTFKYSEFKPDLTTPRSDFFDHRFHDVEHGVQQDLERLENVFFKEKHHGASLEDLIEKSKNNDTKTNLNILTFKSELDENKTKNNSNYKHFETAKGLLVNFDSSYNNTQVFDEAVKIPITTTKLEPVLDNKIKIGDVQEGTERSHFATTTRKNYPTKLSQANKTRDRSSLISNKIETETLKPIEPKPKEVEALPKSTPKDNTINVNKRGSTKYFDSFTTTEIPKKMSSKYMEQPTTVSFKNIIANEQNVQENNIYPVIVPVPSTESSTLQMFEMTEDKEEIDTSTEFTTSSFKNEVVTEANTEFTIGGPKEEFFEMTSEFTTLVPSTMTDISTHEISTTENSNMEERDARFNNEDSADSTTVISTESSTIIPHKLELMDEKISTIIPERLEEVMDTTLNPTEDKTTEENVATTIISEKSTLVEVEITSDITTESVDTETITDHTTEHSEITEEATESTSVISETTVSATTKVPTTKVPATTTVPSIETATNENISVAILELGDVNKMEDSTTTEIGDITESNAIENLTTLDITTIKPTTVEVLSYDTTMAEEPVKSENPNVIIKEEEILNVKTSTESKVTKTTENINLIDTKENDIIKENSTKLNRTDITLANAEIDEDNEEIGEEMEYIEFQNRKTNKTNTDDIEIVHIDPMEHSTVKTETKTTPITDIPRVNLTTEFFTIENEIDGVTEENKLEEDNSGTVIAIVISTVGAICLVALAGLLFVMRRRQKRFNYGQRCTPVSLDSYSMDNVSAHNSVRRKGIIRGSKRSYGNPAFDDSSISHPLNFQGISKYSTNSEDICAEFEEIPQVTARMNELPEGCDTKNRYANVIPLPETRVLLSSLDDDPTSDYINANYVTGPKGVRGYYIACQAPLQNTVNDFWRMIWEQQSKVILMLTHMYENGVEKCVDYLPPSEVLDCHRLFGDFQITLKKREVKDKYIISSLQLKNMVSNSWREITHLWYSGWPEKGVPSEENSLIAFLIEARSYVKLVQNNPDLKTNDVYNENGGNPDVSPVVVHCSPGTGRTGTIIACDIAIREFELKRVVDIPKIVYKIRRDRASSVQTKDQYAFIYRVINMYATKLTGGALDSI